VSTTTTLTALTTLAVALAVAASAAPTSGCPGQGAFPYLDEQPEAAWPALASSWSTGRLGPQAAHCDTAPATLPAGNRCGQGAWSRPSCVAARARQLEHDPLR
jgi:hypothetical protein